MTTNKKRISTNWTKEIRIIKGHILRSNGLGFDGEGYPFREAVRQLREAGKNIVFERAAGMYYLRDGA